MKRLRGYSYKEMSAVSAFTVVEQFVVKPRCCAGYSVAEQVFKFGEPVKMPPYLRFAPPEMFAHFAAGETHPLL